MSRQDRLWHTAGTVLGAIALIVIVLAMCWFMASANYV